MDKTRTLEGLDDVILYDGICKFCNSSVNFILEHERSDSLKFISLQSFLGRLILDRYGFPEDYTDSILFLRGGKLSSKSRAVLRISKFLKMPWSIASAFLVLPSFILDPIYALVAKNRYNWFGKLDACILPPSNHKLRFLE